MSKDVDFTLGKAGGYWIRYKRTYGENDKQDLNPAFSDTRKRINAALNQGVILRRERRKKEGHLPD